MAYPHRTRTRGCGWHTLIECIRGREEDATGTPSSSNATRTRAVGSTSMPHQTRETRWWKHPCPRRNTCLPSPSPQRLFLPSLPPRTPVKVLDQSGRVGLALLCADPGCGWPSRWQRGGWTPAHVVAPTSHPFKRGGGHWRLFFTHAVPMSTEYQPRISARDGVVSVAHMSCQRYLEVIFVVSRTFKAS